MFQPNIINFSSILSLVKLPNMSNPILTTTNSKLDTMVKESSGVVPPPSGVGSSWSKPDRFNCFNYNTIFLKSKSFI